MKIQYKALKFPDWQLEMIANANSILASYAAQGYNLTLRGLYYQFVSRKLFPERYKDANGVTNNQRSYNKLGDLINDARYAGLISWNSLSDITRSLAGGGGYGEPEDIVRSIAAYYSLNKWEDQPNHVEVWVEKDAVKDVVSQAAYKVNAPYFSCRGYVSATAMHDAALRIKRKIKEGKEAIILHLGDHDPSGVDMTRDIEERIGLFLGRDSSKFEVRRIGLTMDQVKRFDLPPDPAKVSDGRSTAYIEKYGEFSWELDALEPAFIEEIILDEVASLTDDDLLAAVLVEEEKKKQTFVDISDNWSQIQGFLYGSNE